MTELQQVENVARPWTPAQGNFEKLDERVWSRKPSKQSGVATTIVGAPTSGTFVLDQLWWDVNTALFICTVAGTPGTWRQLDPAILTAFPGSSIPDKYWVVRADLNFRQFYYDLAGTQWIEIGSAGGLDFKASVRIATTAALPTNTASGSTLTKSSNGAWAAVDGVTLSVGQSILVKDEATGSKNGIYTLTDAGGGGSPWILTRRDDADTSSDITAGMLVGVEEGTTLADALFQLTTNATITLGSTALVFRQVEYTDARVRAALLTGLSTATFAVASSTDTILQAIGKLQAQINNAKVTVAYASGQYLVNCALSNCFQMTAADGDDGPINFQNIQEGRPIILRVITDDPTGVIDSFQYDGESTQVFFASGAGLPTNDAWDYVYTIVRFGTNLYVSMADFNTV
jgi:hypothetical protein